MHLYQVFQNSFNKIAAPGPGLPNNKAGPEVGLHYQEWPQTQAYVGADLDFPQKNNYNTGYDQTGYYMPESMYYGSGTGTMSPAYSMTHSPAIDTPDSNIWSPPTCQQSYLPPNIHDTTRLKPEPDPQLFDDALNIMKSHAQPVPRGQETFLPADQFQSAPPPLISQTGAKKRKADEMSASSSVAASPYSPLSPSSGRVSSSSGAGKGGGSSRPSALTDALLTAPDWM